MITARGPGHDFDVYGPTFQPKSGHVLAPIAKQPKDREFQIPGGELPGFEKLIAMRPLRLLDPLGRMNQAVAHMEDEFRTSCIRLTESSRMWWCSW
jgi:hypothetical protein